MSSVSSSSDEDENFFRLHAKAIAEALQEREAAEQAVATGSLAGTTAAASKSEKERLIHDTYVALCHDDPQVESDLACQYLASALIDPNSSYALSGPLVEGISQLCNNQETKNVASGPPPTNANSESSSEKDTAKNVALTSSAASSSAKGSAMLAWTIHVRIPLLCCQATDLSQVHPFLGSYRPPPPSNPVSEEPEKLLHAEHFKQQQNEDADRLAAMLSQPLEDNHHQTSPSDNVVDNPGLEEEEDEVWAAESDPSDFEFDSGFSYEQQISDFQNSFAEWMIDRTNPIKLSKPTDNTATWKQVRHAVMDLTSQVSYRHVASLWTDPAGVSQLMGSRTPADFLTQFTMTLLIPTPSSKRTSNQPSLYDSPDDEEDALQPQRQLQSMAWYPLWVLRDAAAAVSSKTTLAQYLTLLQTLISVDAAAREPQAAAQKPPKSMAPATYVGLASLSALCQQFVADADDQHQNTKSSQILDRFRELRLSIFELADDLTHALEQEEQMRKSSSAAGESSATSNTSSATTGSRGSEWILWTLLPLLEILTNQRLHDGTCIVAKAESAAQKHHQQSRQQWAGLLQSGFFRQWLLRLQALLLEESKDDTASLDSGSKKRLLEQQLQWQLARRSLLYVISHSMASTTALGKYAWRFPNFAGLVQIDSSFPKAAAFEDASSPSKQEDLNSFSDDCVDNILWNLLAMELAGNGKDVAPTIQWKSASSKGSNSTLPTREESQRKSWNGFQGLCRHVVLVLDLACQEENKKENKGSVDAADKQPYRDPHSRQQHHLVLQSFHRLVNTLVACPLLAKVFVQDLEETSSKKVTKCLDLIQEKLTQYKGPPPSTKTTRAEDDADAGGGDDDVDEDDLEHQKRAKEHSGSENLQDDIHMVRKVLKMLRSLLSSSQSSSSIMSGTVASSSKTD